MLTYEYIYKGETLAYHSLTSLSLSFLTQVADAPLLAPPFPALLHLAAPLQAALLSVAPLPMTLQWRCPVAAGRWRLTVGSVLSTAPWRGLADMPVLVSAGAHGHPDPVSVAALL